MSGGTQFPRNLPVDGISQEVIFGPDDREPA